MTRNPIEPMQQRAAALAGAAEGEACNQTSFKVGGKAFLFVGPGAKGIGFKAMFKLGAAMAAAKQLAAKHPDRFEVGSTGWVTARFSADAPLPKAIWSAWLQESYELAAGGGGGGAKKKTARKQR